MRVFAAVFAGLLIQFQCGIALPQDSVGIVTESLEDPCIQKLGISAYRLTCLELRQATFQCRAEREGVIAAVEMTVADLCVQELGQTAYAMNCLELSAATFDCRLRREREWQERIDAATP